MRGVRSLLTQFRHSMRARVAVVGVGLAVCAAVVGLGVQTLQTGAAGGDCSANSIIKCGINNYGDLTAKYDQNAHGDIRAIMDHYWIKRVPEPGHRVIEGVANNRGEVIADGRVVAKNAASIGRQAIAHSHRIAIAGKTYYQTSHVGGRAFKPGTTQLATLVVLDAHGNFKYAIIKSCGNPIYATPVPPPTPPQPPKPPKPPVKPPVKKESTLRCDAVDVTKLSRTKYRFEVEYTDKNVTIKQFIFTVRDQAGKVVHTQASRDDTFTFEMQTAGTYTAEFSIKAVVDGQEQTITGEKCKVTFVVAEEDKVIVCELATRQLNKVITKAEFEADQKKPQAERKYSTNPSDCQPKPVTPKKENCPIPGKEHLPKDSPDCKEVPVTPPQLPKTGPFDIAGALIGATGISVAAYYYAASRRNM